MALLMMEGFDYVNTTADLVAGTVAPLWAFNTSNSSFETGRSGNGLCFRPCNTYNGGTTNVVYLQILAGSLTEFVLGLAQYFRERFNNYADYRWIQFADSASNVQVMLRINSSDYLELWDYLNTTLLATSSIPITYNTWSYFEVKVKCHNTSGYVEVKQNGELILSKHNYNTNQRTTNNISIITLMSPQRGTSFDDMYLLDTTGAAPLNDYLGPVYVNKILPSVDGTRSEFTPRVGAANHYGEVDDYPTYDNDTTYVESGTDLAEDLYKISAQSGTQVFAVQARSRSRATTCGNVKVGNVLRDSNGNNPQTSYSGLLSINSWTDLLTIYPTAPDGSVWDFTKLSALQFGVRVKKGI